MNTRKTRSDSCHCLGNIHHVLWRKLFLFFSTAARCHEGPIFIFLSRDVSELCSLSDLWVNVEYNQYYLDCKRLCEIFHKGLTYSVMAKIRRRETWLAREELFVFLLRHRGEISCADVKNIWTCYSGLNTLIFPSLHIHFPAICADKLINLIFTIFMLP